MSGKKGKKTKGVTMSVHEFQNIDGGSAPGKPLSSGLWADDMDDELEYGHSSRLKEPLSLPTAPRAARDPDYNDENIPKKGPFIAYISNLPYEVEDDEIYMFFSDLKISKVSLPKEGNKQKGFGYVQFEDRQSLIDAMNKVDRTIGTRRIRIDVSNNTMDDKRNRNKSSRRDYNDDADRMTTGDWRSGLRDDIDSSNSDRFRSRGGGGGGGGGFDRRDNRDNLDDNRQGAWREGDRPRSYDRPSFRDNRPSGDDTTGRDWNRFSDRPSNRDQDFDKGGSFVQRRHNDTERERNWSHRENRNLPERDRNQSDETPEPRTRPKLNLQPRTKPIESVLPKPEPEGEESSSTKETGIESEKKPIPTPVPAATIFGAAKPVDTAAREREIEERLKKENESRPKEEEPERRPAWTRRNGENRDGDRRPTWRTGNEHRENASFDRSGPRNRHQSNQAHHDQKDNHISRSNSKEQSRNSPGPLYVPPRGASKQADLHRTTEKTERSRELTEEEELSKMPKATDKEAPNFVASNKYSLLPDDVDLDNIQN